MDAIAAGNLTCRAHLLGVVSIAKQYIWWCSVMRIGACLCIDNISLREKESERGGEGEGRMRGRGEDEREREREGRERKRERSEGGIERMGYKEGESDREILIILTTNLAACVCVCVCKMWPISALTLSFLLQTSRKFCSHSKIPIRCLWTAFCVPLSYIFYEKQYFEWSMYAECNSGPLK